MDFSRKKIVRIIIYNFLDNNNNHRRFSFYFLTFVLNGVLAPVIRESVCKNSTFIRGGLQEKKKNDSQPVYATILKTSITILLQMDVSGYSLINCRI